MRSIPASVPDLLSLGLSLAEVAAHRIPIQHAPVCVHNLLQRAYLSCIRDTHPIAGDVALNEAHLRSGEVGGRL
jgi:hypothetical protein